MALKQPLANTHPLSHDVRKNIVFSAPVPGSSLTKEFGAAPYEKPPQHTKLPDAMYHMMDQLTEPMYMKQLLSLMDAGMPIEVIVRTLIFTGFSLGKWTSDLGMLMYKPLMLALMAIAHRAGLKDTPVIMPRTLAQHRMNNLDNFSATSQMKALRDKAFGREKPVTAAPPPIVPPTASGFMQRGSS